VLDAALKALEEEIDHKIDRNEK
jgi:hypothetical protein